MPGPIVNYRFISDSAVVILHVQGRVDWTEEMYDSVANDELASIVIDPESFYMDDAF